MTEGINADRRIVPLVQPERRGGPARDRARPRLGAQQRVADPKTRLGLKARARSFDTPPAPDEKSMPIWPYLALFAIMGSILVAY